MSGVNPEEPLWQRPERPLRPFGRIFREKCGLRTAYGRGFSARDWVRFWSGERDYRLCGDVCYG
jgi:hypothetical protein